MKYILVTGGAGFIGSHTSVVLIENGYNLLIVDNFINSNPEVINRIKNITKLHKKEFNHRIKLKNIDLRDQKSLNNLFEEEYLNNNEIDGVIHFAGLKAVGESVKNPIKYWDFNVNGAINLIKVMAKYDCKLIVFSSSATIYGFPSKVPIEEDSLINPINPYGQTKATIEKLLKDTFMSTQKEWRIACLRYFNPVGAHSSGILGEDPSGIPNNLFPFITQVAVGIRKELKIFGKDWNTKDGTGVRDYIHVMDLAEGHLAALNFLKNSDPQLLEVNLGTGKGTTVLELVNAFEESTGKRIPYEFVDRRGGDAPTTFADVKKAKNILNWVAKRDIKDICKDGWNWQSNNPKGY